MPDEQVTFSFGKNWEEFVRNHFHQDRVVALRQHTLSFLELPDLKGRSFLDVGCGSGLASLAALEAGAERVVSFDIDPFSVRATEWLRSYKGDPAHWSVSQGSILDDVFLKTLEPAEIVYCWGVLHHTGRVWDALEKAAGLMGREGLFYFSLYTTDAHCNHWLEVKKQYNRASPAKKRWMEWAYVLVYTFGGKLLQGKNPIRHIRNYRKSRGMAYMTDVRDWLGGYPFEHAKIEEVLHFCRKRLDLELINIQTGKPNTEYLFARRSPPP